MKVLQHKLDILNILCSSRKQLAKAKVTKSENLHLDITSYGLSTDLVSCKPVPEHSPLNECGHQNVKVRKVKVFSSSPRTTLFYIANQL